MSKATNRFFEQISSGQEVTPIQAAVEGIQAVAPGLTWDNFVKGVGAELGRLGTQGSAELANALFNGSSYVAYGDGQRSAEVEQPAMEQPQQQNEGLSM